MVLGRAPGGTLGPILGVPLGPVPLGETLGVALIAALILGDELGTSALVREHAL